MKAVQRSRLTLANIQIKSGEKFKAVAQAIDVLEKEAFIRSGEIELIDAFICPDIDLVPFYQSQDPTECLLARICIALNVQRLGKDARKDYQEIVEHEYKVRKIAKELDRTHKLPAHGSK